MAVACGADLRVAARANAGLAGIGLGTRVAVVATSPSFLLGLEHGPLEGSQTLVL